MPTINLSFDISQEKADFLQNWFATWNLSLSEPYNSYQDFLIDILHRKIRAVLKDYYTINPREINDADLSVDQIERIREIINE